MNIFKIQRKLFLQSTQVVGEEFFVIFCFIAGTTAFKIRNHAKNVTFHARFGTTSATSYVSFTQF